MAVSLSTAINEHNAWFHSRQDEYYSWFLNGGNEGLSILLEGLSGLTQGVPVAVQSHSKYIFDNGEYSFLLVGVNGEAKKLSPGFDLSEENTSLGVDEVIPNTTINAGTGMETVRYIPANSNYEFPLIDKQSVETCIDDSFLVVVDEVYEPYFTKLLPAAEAAEEEVDIHIKNTFKELLVGSLATMMVSAYYSVPWAELGEECGGMKEAYEWFVQQTFSGFSERALHKATEGLNAEDMGEYSESD